MKNLTCQLLTDMSDGRTLSNIELSKSYGWRFGGRLYQLRQYGVKFTKTKGEGYIEYWKIEYIPKTIDYSGDRLKIRQLTFKEKIINFIK